MDLKLDDIKFRLAANDDDIALRELYDYLGNNLFHLALAIVRSKEMAEEVVEDVFMKIWEKRKELAKLEQFRFYVYVMTKNVSRDYLRKYGNKKNIDIDELSLPFYRVDATPEDLMVTEELIQQINKAINELPVKCRLIFKLVKEDGLKYREVAELLNLSTKTVENQVGIALKKIHAAIGYKLAN